MITAIIAGIAAVASAIAAWISAVLQAVNAVPWKRIFTWLLLGSVIFYFGQVIWLCFTTAWSCVTTVFDSSSITSSSPHDVFTKALDFTLFWSNFGAFVPRFFRWLMWYTGCDWLFWLFFQFVHFWFIGYLLNSFGKPIGVFLHRAMNSL